MHWFQSNYVAASRDGRGGGLMVAHFLSIAKFNFSRKQLGIGLYAE